MDIYDTWKLYKDKMEEEITKFNQANKEGDFPAMTIAKNETKRIYLKFIELLKLESQNTQQAFREQLDSFYKELKLMSDYIKNNEGKVILNDAPKDEKN